MDHTRLSSLSGLTLAKSLLLQLLEERVTGRPGAAPSKKGSRSKRLE
jgi:hypothetical protein